MFGKRKTDFAYFDIAAGEWIFNRNAAEGLMAGARASVADSRATHVSVENSPKPDDRLVKELTYQMRRPAERSAEAIAADRVAEFAADVIKVLGLDYPEWKPIVGGGDRHRIAKRFIRDVHDGLAALEAADRQATLKKLRGDDPA